MSYNQFLLTRLMRGATIKSWGLYETNTISTHAPHARRDSNVKLDSDLLLFLLTRLMRGATLKLVKVINNRTFLLTRLMRGATPRKKRVLSSNLDFYSRASCEARHLQISFDKFIYKISTHAPHARRDPSFKMRKWICLYFYSRASCEARLS